MNINTLGNIMQGAGSMLNAFTQTDAEAKAAQKAKYDNFGKNLLGGLANGLIGFGKAMVSNKLQNTGGALPGQGMVNGNMTQQTQVPTAQEGTQLLAVNPVKLAEIMKKATEAAKMLSKTGRKGLYKAAPKITKEATTPEEAEALLEKFRETRAKRPLTPAERSLRDRTVVGLDEYEYSRDANSFNVEPRFSTPLPHPKDPYMDVIDPREVPLSTIRKARWENQSTPLYHWVGEELPW